MTRIVLGILLLVVHPSVTVGDDQALPRARDSYLATLSDAEKELTDALLDKANTSQRAGDLSSFQSIQAEADAFKETGRLPSSISTRNYERKVRLARQRMEQAYEAAIRNYTKAGDIPRAEATQKEPVEFQADADAFASSLLQKGSVWTGALECRLDNGPPKSYDVSFTILDRDGTKFTARYQVGGQLREVRGTVVGQRLQWLAKDVKVLKGHAGFDYAGSIIKDSIVVTYSGISEKGVADAGIMSLNVSPP